ncbi:hypothetical protein HYW82_00620 [Candidatus Peregrinibacteria bacterium]|nr:hypothetical protein [Candidatus Peregrinibacteria bacterium]
MTTTPDQLPVNPEDAKDAKEQTMAFAKAALEALKAKGKSSMERLEIFFTILLEKMGVLEEEEKKISEDSQKAIGQNVDDAVTDAKEAAKLDREKTNKEDQDFYDAMVTGVIKEYKSMPVHAQGKGLDAWKKLTAAMNGGKAQPLDSQEAAALAGTMVMTLRNFKKQFDSKQELTTALKRLQEISKNTAFPFEKLLQTKGIFNMDIQAKLAFVGLFGLDKPAALKLSGYVEEIKEGKISDEAVEFIRMRFFPNTNAVNVKEVLTTLQVSLKDSGSLAMGTLANIAFLISDADYDNLVKILTGKNE